MAQARTKLTKRFGPVLRETRLRAKLTQEALAHAAGVHPTYISQVERGLLSPTLDKLDALARALGVRPSTLIGRSER